MKGDSVNNYSFFFFKFIISVRGGHYEYSFWAKKSRYTTAWGYFPPRTVTVAQSRPLTSIQC